MTKKLYAFAETGVTSAGIIEVANCLPLWTDMENLQLTQLDVYHKSSAARRVLVASITVPLPNVLPAETKVGKLYLRSFWNTWKSHDVEHVARLREEHGDASYALSYVMTAGTGKRTGYFDAAFTGPEADQYEVRPRITVRYRKRFWHWIFTPNPKHKAAVLYV